MNITMSDEEFNDTIDDATNAVLAAVNTLLFDRYGKRAYTTAERIHELKVVLHMVEAYTTETYVWGNLDVMVKHPYRADPIAEEVTCSECDDLFTRRIGENIQNCLKCDACY
jgi:formylmethanofuran dehydrogenase subunit E